MASVSQGTRRATPAAGRHQRDGAPRSRPSRVNVGQKERNVSMAAGAIAALQGLSRGSLPGLLSAAVGGYLIYRGATGQCPLYRSLGIDTYHLHGEPPGDEISEKGVHVEQAMLIQRPAEQLYQFWHNFENLPRFMSHLVSVQRLDERRWHWVAQAPRLAGGQVEWDAEVTADEPSRRIAWHSLPGSQVQQLGEVRFSPAPGDRGTEIHVFMDYVPPAGKLGHLIALLFQQDPAQQMREELRNFKRLMETGEILTTVGQPRGTCTGAGKIQQKL